LVRSGIVERVDRALVGHRKPLAVSVDGERDRGVTELALHVDDRLAPAIRSDAKV